MENGDMDQQTEKKGEKEIEAKDMFVYNISHEARTPINVVLGYTEMIMRESRESSTVAYASNIQEAGRTLLAIVNDTTDFSSIQDGTLYLEREPYSLFSVLQNLVSFGNFYAEKKKLDFRIELSEELPQELLGDSVRLNQICTNLISNAVKFTRGGYVCMKVDWEKTQENKGLLRFCIKDTGMGIKEEDISKLETGLCKMDGEKIRHIPGAGLGLPLVVGLLKLMGSRLKIQSVWGEGTTVSFAIEQELTDRDYNKKTEIHHEEKRADSEEYIISDAKILVVDDNIMNLELLKGMLERRRATVDLAMNGEEALAKVKENSYDLILMDHMMPVLDGMEAMRIIRRENLCKGVPVVALTANAEVGARKKYLEAGFHTYLKKPVLSYELYQLLKDTLPKYLINYVREPELPVQKEEKDNFLSRLDFLDTETGMAYCGGTEEFYKEILLTFFRKRKPEDIEAFYERKDWENYRILIHGLKSTAATIGATELSEQAKMLELAAKEENHYYIDRHHAGVMREYHRILEGIGVALNEKRIEKPLEKKKEEKEHVLVVDDDIINIKAAEKILKNHFDVNCVFSGKEALEYAEKYVPELILLDMYMPEMDGLAVMEQLKNNPVTKEIPIIFMAIEKDREAEIKSFKRGAQDFIAKPLVADILLQRVSHTLELSRLQKNLQREVDKQTKQAEERRRKVECLSEQIITALTETIDVKDSYTQGHSKRVSEYAVMIATRAGKNEKEQERIRYMGMLHDIGKIGIPDFIITKSSSLSETEFIVARKHPEIGAEILSTISEIPDLAVGARYHHERFDGTGYPDGLKGEEIPDAARIIAVADAYDAMASKRSYRDVLPQQIIYEEIRRGRGTQFDPVYADVMLELMEEDVNYDMREK